MANPDGAHIYQDTPKDGSGLPKGEGLPDPIKEGALDDERPFWTVKKSRLQWTPHDGESPDNRRPPFPRHQGTLDDEGFSLGIEGGPPPPDIRGGPPQVMWDPPQTMKDCPPQMAKDPSDSKGPSWTIEEPPQMDPRRQPKTPLDDEGPPDGQGPP